MIGESPRPDSGGHTGAGPDRVESAGTGAAGRAGASSAAGNSEPDFSAPDVSHPTWPASTRPGGVRRGSRRVVITLIVLVLAGSAIAVGITQNRAVQATGSAHSAGVEGDTSIVTATVELSTLTDQIRLNGQLDYGDLRDLPVADGILTALPAPGEVIAVGQPVYEADGRPVMLLQGDRPLWRDLTSGVDDGADVLQLEQNLERLGFFTREPDERFDWWTKNAIQQWQKSLGLQQSGTVAAKEVVIAQSSSIRIAAVGATLGETGVRPAQYTETSLRAIARLTAAQARELQPGTPVIVQLPDGSEITSVLDAIDPGGEATGEEEQATAPTATIEFADQSQVADTGPAAVRIHIDDSDNQLETLVVPVTALLATPEGGYAVEVVTAAGIVRVPVEIGLVADARAQILASGSEVENAPADALALSVGDAVVIAR